MIRLTISFLDTEICIRIDAAGGATRLSKIQTCHPLPSKSRSHIIRRSEKRGKLRETRTSEADTSAENDT